MRAVASTETSYTEMKRAGGVGARRDYIGAPGSLEAGPQAFLVERPYPNPRVAPHFHDIDQFQVIPGETRQPYGGWLPASAR